MARIGPFDLEFGLDASRPPAEHDDAGREKHRLFDIMGHENRGEAFPAPEGHKLRLQRQTRQRIELAERLIEQQQGGIVDERASKRGALSHAARQLMGISLAEVAKADEIERGIDATRSCFSTPRASSPVATLFQTVAHGNSVGS